MLLFLLLQNNSLEQQDVQASMGRRKECPQVAMALEDAKDGPSSFAHPTLRVPTARMADG